MSENVLSLPIAYYNKLRAQGYEAGNAFEETRARFATFKGVPDEVEDYKDVLADAYVASRLGDYYMPDEGVHMEIAYELERQNAFTWIAKGIFELTPEGADAGAKYARLRHIENQRSMLLVEDQAVLENYQSAKAMVAYGLAALPLIFFMIMVFWG